MNDLQVLSFEKVKFSSVRRYCENTFQASESLVSIDPSISCSNPEMSLD